jgi:TRAP-type mannitol/chloroaromatic compound transport system permease small subunit
MHDDNPISRVVQPVARVAAIVSGYAVLAIAFLTGIEILGRKFFGMSLQGVDDYGGYVLAITAAVGASYTMAQRGHTRIDLFLVRMPQGLQRWLNVLAMVTLAGLACYAVLRGWSVLAESIEFKSVSSTPAQTPLWAPQTAWLVGLALFALFALAYAIHALVLLMRGTPELNHWYGPHTVQEELDEELAAARERDVHRGTPGDRV